MATTYYVGHRGARRWKRVGIGLAVVAILVGSGVACHLFWCKQHNARDNAKQAAVSATAPAGYVRYHESLFYIDLPQGWKSVKTQKGEPQQWTSPKKDQTLTVYVDTPTEDVAISHIVPVSVRQNEIVPLESSIRCSAFAAQENAVNGQVAVSWQGVPFICLLAGEQASVLGIGVPQAQKTNVVTLTSENNEVHDVFMTMSEQNLTPSTALFQKIVSSFRFR